MVVEQVVWTQRFEKDLRRIRDEALKQKLKKQIRKIMKNPEAGKPLRYALRGEMTLYVKPYRLIYAYSGKILFLLRFRHREEAY